MAKYLLDANACIVFIKYADSRVRERLEKTEPGLISVCFVVKYAMFHGSLKSDNPQRSLQKQSEFFDQFESLPFDYRGAKFSARIRADLSKTGNLIGACDIQIAAIALANNLTLVTHNVSEFGCVFDLGIGDWEA